MPSRCIPKQHIYLVENYPVTYLFRVNDTMCFFYLPMFLFLNEEISITS